MGISVLTWLKDKTKSKEDCRSYTLIKDQNEIKNCNSIFGNKVPKDSIFLKNSSNEVVAYHKDSDYTSIYESHSNLNDKAKENFVGGVNSRRGIKLDLNGDKDFKDPGDVNYSGPMEFETLGKSGKNTIIKYDIYNEFLDNQ